MPPQPTIHEQLMNFVEQYTNEQNSFEDKDNKAAATRARKALGEISKLVKQRRAEIQERKNSL